MGIFFRPIDGYIVVERKQKRAFSVRVHMAEDDDEDTFGEFSFSSFPSNSPATLHSQSKGLNSLPAAADDDEWGDFVKSPQQSQTSDPHIHEFFGKGNSSSHDLASPPRWVKPSGALPLSIFGDAEEENGKDLKDFNQSRTNAIAGEFNSKFSDNNVSNSKNLSITSLYSRTSQIKREDGPDYNSISRFDLMPNDSTSVQNGFHSSSNHNLARSDFTEWKTVSFDGAVGRSDESELIKNENNELSSKSNALDLTQNASLFGVWNLDFNEINSNSKTVKSFVKSPSSNLDMNGGKQELNAAAAADDDDGDEGWEFKDAYSESRTRDVNNKVDFMECKISAESAQSPGSVSDSKEALSLFSSSNGIIDLFATPTKSVDFFSTSTGISCGSEKVDLIGVHPSTENLNGFISDTNPKFKQYDIEGTLIPSSDVGSTEYEDFGEFTAACLETGPKTGEASNTDILGSPEDTVSVLDSQIQEKDTQLNNRKGALPLSIFGNEEPESDGSLDVQDPFMHQSTSDQRHGHTPKTVISINDLISSLYSQTEKASFSNPTQEPTTIQLNLSNLVSDSNLVNNADQLDATSWDFKDASSQTRVDNETSLYSIGDTYLSSNLKLNNYLDFYNKLKGELCFVAKYHIDSLKEPRGNTALSGEDASMVSLISEFQLVCKELERINYFCKEQDKQDHPSGNNCLDEFVEILLEPQFQILESEYHLSEKLLLVGKDMKSAVELMKHTITMLKILTIGTSEEQTAYISIWSEMISICAQELKHGASIWNQATKKHVQSQLLAETQGKNFVLALGEIYRVVVVLGASAKLFKPWIISCSIDSSGIYLLLQECDALWSTSGLKEALAGISVPTALDEASLFKSIEDIRGLDAVALENYLHTEKDSLCRLSMLTAGVAPGMKMTMWGEEQCFVTLANLWANLISCNPPKLPRLQVG